ncbi:GH25 family lysozyme [Sphingomonas sp. KR1UV-12]|uniref:GH25 family lysozyme n=1 Tax=Sphingomonas aurea TaxID=3063994 RepID=A0ABT9EFX2_9SPHN|nr:GH25 family lysozyme [Sphingomonas sp. KR1UV-12]MDP1025871.1 GH25 family lysozyme [Sphingomonas sp. KR1UV-12]
MNFLAKAAAILVAAGAIGIGGWHYATGWAPDHATYPLQGIDLGENPGEIEWGTVRAAGADFAYLAATAGADRRVPSFEANWNALPAAGLRRGAVHLYSLCQPAVAQANTFNTTVPRIADALPPAVDIDLREDCAARPEPAALAADLRRFIALVEAHTGKPVLLRISKPVEHVFALTAAIQRPVWASGNFFAPGYPARPWAMWRASDLRRVDGIEGPVNWNVVRP